MSGRAPQLTRIFRAGREKQSLRHESFRFRLPRCAGLHCYHRHHDCRHRRYCRWDGLAGSRSVTVPEQNSSVKARDSCGSVQNKSAAQSCCAWVADYKNADRDSFCRCCQNSDGCCCRLAQRTVNPGRPRFPLASRHEPMEDDWCRCHGPIAPENSSAGWSFQILRADDRDRWHCPALPKCVSSCLPFANQRCLRHRRNCGSNYSWPKAACYSTAPAGGSSSRMTALHYPGARSLPANCALGLLRCAPASNQSY